jgi:two-component system, NtrC family, response regulator HydG
MHARLVIVRGEGTPSSFELDPDNPITLGRSRDNMMVLHDEHASRLHAQVYFQDGHWFLRDIDTRNGTRIDSERVRGATPLLDGQEIAIADMRLRFEELEGVRVPPPEPPPPPKPQPDSAHTTLLADELAVLHKFMTATVKETDPGMVIRHMLSTVLRQTRATVAGFLSLDEDEPLQKVVLPEKAKVDFCLSRQLTQRVQQEGKAVWLKTGSAGFTESDSLMPFQDAVCVPVRAEEGAPLGALHVYKSGRFFNERELRFCEVVAGYAANGLARLRLCRSLEAENTRLRGGRSSGPEKIIGGSKAMQQLYETIHRAARCRSTVLIHGESGSGKELVALELHRLSARCNGPLVVANCGALPPTLLESELFGHVKGAFTDAVTARDGLFKQADDGTLFLDEIGDMSLDCQVKLLRVLEDKGFRPVGGTEEIKTDVRLIAATHRDLNKEVKATRFRPDLFFRLRVVVIHVPPLREHREDIPELVGHFLKKFNAESGKRKALSDEALQRLVEYPWPGNVRELRTVIESAVMMSERDVIEAHELWLQDAPITTDQPLSLNLEHVEAWAIRQAMQKTKGNVTKAARILGVARETLGLKLRKYQIAREEWVEQRKDGSA